jgi:hypothetical protein
MFFVHPHSGDVGDYGWMAQQQHRDAASTAPASWAQWHRLAQPTRRPANSAAALKQQQRRCEGGRFGAGQLVCCAHAHLGHDSFAVESFNMHDALAHLEHQQVRVCAG